MARLRVLELYCGVGGCAAALERLAGDAATVAAAVDVNRQALAVYSHNFSHPAVAGVVESLGRERLRAFDADLWWLSPPCQPFTERGRRRDVDDPRAGTFLALLADLAAVRPAYVALENVPGFRGSRAHARLRATLADAGYRDVRETVLCPTELGVPNRRRRFYLVASRRELLPFPRLPRWAAPLAAYLDAAAAPELAVDPVLAARYTGALHVVRSDDPAAVTNCFTSAYGRSPVRSGSYLRCDGGVEGGIRRFAPREIARLLGFSDAFALPAGLDLATGWRLMGNSLSVDAVQTVLAAIPELAP